MLKNDLVNMEFDVYFRDEKTAHIKIVDSKLVENISYSDNFIKNPFLNVKTSESALYGIRIRVVPPERCKNDPRILQYLDMAEYNAYQICKKTHGVNISDFTWFKFPDDDESLCWDMLNPRIFISNEEKA